MKIKQIFSIYIIVLYISGCGLENNSENEEYNVQLESRLETNKRTTGIHWLTKWPRIGECSKTEDKDRLYNDEKLKKWQDEMSNNGWYEKNKFGNSEVAGKDFVEDKYSSSLNGLDKYYFDNVRAAAISTHGSLTYNYYWRGSLTKNIQNYGCRIKSEHMRLGESTDSLYGEFPGSLDFFHNLACYSATRGAVYQSWSRAFQGIHFITGFDKISYSSWWNNDDLEDFAYWAHDHWFYEADEMSYVWLDQMLHWNWYGIDDDTCPVVVTVDIDNTRSYERMYNEKYKSNWSDVARNKWKHMRTRYWKSCKPEPN